MEVQELIPDDGDDGYVPLADCDKIRFSVTNPTRLRKGTKIKEALKLDKVEDPKKIPASLPAKTKKVK